MRQAYLDCSSGISGDMFLAVLIDAGVPVDRLFAELKKIRLGFYEFKRTRAGRGGLVGTRVEIRAPGEQPHRTLPDIQNLLVTASLPAKAAAQALMVFDRLAEVEEGFTISLPAKCTSTRSARSMPSSISWERAWAWSCWRSPTSSARP